MTLRNRVQTIERSLGPDGGRISQMTDTNLCRRIVELIDVDAKATPSIFSHLQDGLVQRHRQELIRAIETGGFDGRHTRKYDADAAAVLSAVKQAQALRS